MAFSGNFAYTALPKELLEMSAELDALGGGDTRVAKVEGYCRVYPPIDETPAPILSVDHEKAVMVVRDPRASGSTPHAKGVRKYQVNAVLNEHYSLSEVCRSALNWFWDGFNANIISLGQTGTGKSLSLWGRSTEEDSVFMPLLEEVFARIEEAGASDFQIGLSCWDILGNDVVDLFTTDHTKSHTFGRKFGVHTVRSVLAVNANSYESAVKLLELARSRSVNWTSATAMDRPEFLPNRAHHCVRLVLHNARMGWVSSLHIVDLVGHGRTPSHVPPVNYGELERERRIARQHLVGFGRIIAELSKPTTDSKESGPTLVSARDSVLSQLVGPLITTNSKTLFLTCVSPQKEDFAETVHSLQFVKRAQTITIGCAKTLGITDDSLSFVPDDQVLTLDQVWPAQNGNTPAPHQQPRYPSPTEPQSRNSSRRKENESGGLRTSINDEEETRESQRQTHPAKNRQRTKPQSQQLQQPQQQQSKQQIQQQQPIKKPSSPQRPSPHHHSPHDQSPNSTPDHSPHPSPHSSPHPSPRHQSPQQSPHHHYPHQTPHPPLHSSPRNHSPRRTSPPRQMSSPRNDSFREEPAVSDISMLSVHDLNSNGGFDVSEKRKRKENVPVTGKDRRKPGVRGGGTRGGGVNTSVTNIKQKMRNMINVLESEEGNREEEEEEGEEEEEVYNNNNNNGNGINEQEDDTQYDTMYTSTYKSNIQSHHQQIIHNQHQLLHHAIPTSPNEGRSQGHSMHDMNSSSMMAELIMLKKNYESVLKALDRAETLKSQFAEKAAEAEHRVTEVQLQYQLKVDEVVGENLQLRALVRRLEHQSDYTDVFDVYERDMARIGAELKRLRDENLSLYDKIEAFADTPATGAPTAASALRKKSSAHASTLLSQELEEVKSDSLRQERKYMLMQRALEEASKQLSALGTTATNKDEQIKRLRENLTHAEARVRATQADCDLVRTQNFEMRAQIDAEAAQIEALTKHLENIREEYIAERKTEILGRLGTSSGREKEKDKSGKVVISQSITQLFDRLHELDVIDPKYATLLNKLRKEFERLEAEFAAKETEQQKLINLCMENMPQTDSYLKNIAKFKEILGNNAKVITKMKAAFH